MRNTASRRLKTTKCCGLSTASPTVKADAVDIDLDKYAGIARLTELDESNIPEWAENSIARDFAERHKDSLRYVNEWGRWLHYDGTRWIPDKTLYAYDLVRDLCDDIARRQDDRRVAGIASARSVHAVTQ